MNLRDLGNSREAWQARIVVWSVLAAGFLIAAWLTPGDPETDARVVAEQAARAQAAAVQQPRQEQ